MVGTDCQREERVTMEHTYLNSARDQHVCPHCDVDWWKFCGMDHIETMTPPVWRHEHDSTGKSVFVIEIECPKCYEWFWFHADGTYLETLVDLMNS